MQEQRGKSEEARGKRLLDKEIKEINEIKEKCHPE